MFLVLSFRVLFGVGKRCERYVHTFLSVCPIRFDGLGMPFGCVHVDGSFIRPRCVSESSKLLPLPQV